MADDTNDKRLMCPKFNCQKGEAFDRWAKLFLDAADGKGDEEASWADTFLGNDTTVGLSAVQMKKRVTRNREAVASLLYHLDDESMKAVIRAEA